MYAKTRCLFALMGNFITGQPIGVLDGIDMQYAGKVRKVDAEGINAQLGLGNIVLLNCEGPSPTGEIFNLQDLARHARLPLVAGEADVGNGWLPSVVQCDSFCHTRSHAFFDPLVTVDIEQNWHPFLAESVTPNADSTVFTIKLRPGIKFTDGTDLTSDVAMFNFNNAAKSLLVGAGFEEVGVRVEPFTSELVGMAAFLADLLTFAGVEVEAHIVQGPNPREGLAQALGLQQRLLGRYYSFSSN